MSAYPIISVNGISLVDASQRWGVSKSQQLFRNLPGTRNTSIQVPGRSGVLWPAVDPYDVTQFPVTLTVFGAGTTVDAQYDDLTANIESLYFLLSQTPVTLTVQTSSSTSSKRVAVGRVTTVSAPTFINQDSAEITVVYEIPDVFWRSDTVVTGTAWSIDPGSSGSTIAHDPNVFTGSTAPITDAELLIKGPFSQVKVYNPTDANGLNNGLIANVTATSTQYLYLNCGTLQASLNSSALWDTSGTDVTASVDGFGTDPHPGWLTLLPIVASGTFDVSSDRVVRLSSFWSGSGAGATLNVRGKKAYL